MSDNHFDVAITAGRVIDPETGLDDVRNVGVRGNKIAAVTSETITGDSTIDASGLVVAAGFIDMHQHNTPSPFGQHLALRDGVTTTLELEAGVYPIDRWYGSLEGKSRTNFGASVGMLGIREHVLNDGYVTSNSGDFMLDFMLPPDQATTSMRWSTQVATPDQIEQFAAMLEQGLGQGSVGVGFAVGYAMAGCTQEESVICQRLAGKYGEAVFMHGRFSSQMPPTGGILSILELMGPQEVYGGGLVVQHMTAQTLNETPAALKLIDNARAQGIQVIAEIYPYNYGASVAMAPYLHPDNYQRNMGRSYGDIIETSNLKPLTKDRYDELQKTAPGTSIMFYNATEQTVYDALAHPSTVLGSDAFPFTLIDSGDQAWDWDVAFDSVTGHPRGSGSHARLLAWVRDKKVDIPWSLAVSKMSYMIARFLEDNGVPQMAGKGRIQEGKDADITIFDPDAVTDNGTMKQGALPSTGIPHVLVNGTVVVKDSKALDDVFPGAAIHGQPATQ